MTSVEHFLNDIKKAMKLSVCQPLINTTDNLAAISARIQNVLDRHYYEGRLLKKYIARVETKITNRDNLAIYQYDVPDQCELFFDDNDGNKNVKVVICE
jgi:hypothetical protein